MANCTLDGAAPYDCEGCDLRQATLKGRDLKKANFRKANLSGLDLSDMDLSGADLSGAILDKTKLDRTVLRNAIIPFAALGTKWNGLDLTGARIEGMPQDLSRLAARRCTLDGFNFSKMKLVGALFEACSLQNAKFVECKLVNASFTRATRLSGADFTSADLALAVLDTAVLDKAVFRRAALAGTSFLNARMEGTVFEGIDLAEARFSNPPAFSRDINNLTSFKDATLHACVLAKEWSYLDLRGTTLLGLDPGADYSNLRAEGANLSGRSFASFMLDDANFSRATLHGCTFDKAQLNRANFRGAQGRLASFRGAVLIYANFSPIGSNGEQPAVLPGVDFSSAILTRASFAYARMAPAPDGRDPKISTRSLFIGAQMESMGLNQADLSEAVLNSGVLLHGSNLTGAKLKKADLTGVQMGAYATFFSLSGRADQADYDAFLSDLDGAGREHLKRLFMDRGGSHVLANPRVAVTAPGYSWTIEDGTARFYVVRWESDDKALALVVSREVSAATLSHADLRDAVLRDADLREVTAQGIWLYGSATKLGGAKLDGIKLVDAHLQMIDLTGAKLYGADLTRATLVGANFQRAAMQKVNLGSAALQGAKFLDTDLNGVKMERAAVAVHMASGTTGGVYLLALEPSTAVTKIVDEMGQLSKIYAIKRDNQKQLDGGELQKLVFTSTDTLRFSSKASVARNVDGWIITDGLEQYHAWVAEDDSLNDFIQIRLAKADALTGLFTSKLNIKLRDHFSIFRAADSQWVLDNDAQNNPAEGHCTFRLVRSNAGKLLVYATASRIKEWDEKNARAKMVTRTYYATVLCSGGAAANCDPYLAPTVLGPDTICPNGRFLRENQRDNVPWLDMLRV